MIPLCIPEIAGNEWKYIKECLDTNWVSSVGSYVNLFEDKFKEYINTKSAVVTMNGTAAITLALEILGVGPGDEVIVPSLTFIASVNPIKYVGATPVFVDVDYDTWVMDVEKVEELITDRTKAIIPVHLYGSVVDMDKLMDIAKKHDLYVIEDATEALGSEYMSEMNKEDHATWCKAGTIGHFGAFSFNGNKTITTGAGGMLITNSEELGKKAKYLSTQAKTVLPNGTFLHNEIGYNYGMPNILAAMGVAQIEVLEDFIIKKKEHAKMYNEFLKEIDGINLLKKKENVKSSEWLYSAVIKKGFGKRRDEVIQGLQKEEIIARPFFYPVHKMKPYINEKCGDMINTMKLSEEGINLPSSVGIKEEEIEKICNVIKTLKGVI